MSDTLTEPFKEIIRLRAKVTQLQEYNTEAVLKNRAQAEEIKRLREALNRTLDDLMWDCGGEPCGALGQTIERITAALKEDSHGS